MPHEIMMEDVNKKKARLGQRFHLEYSVQFPVITKSHINDQHACCTVCKCDFDISHSGIGDVKKHVAQINTLARQLLVLVLVRSQISLLEVKICP